MSLLNKISIMRYLFVLLIFIATNLLAQNSANEFDNNPTLKINLKNGYSIKYSKILSVDSLQLTVKLLNTDTMHIRFDEINNAKELILVYNLERDKEKRKADNLALLEKRKIEEKASEEKRKADERTVQEKRRAEEQALQIKNKTEKENYINDAYSKNHFLFGIGLTTEGKDYYNKLEDYSFSQTTLLKGSSTDNYTGIELNFDYLKNKTKQRNLIFSFSACYLGYDLKSLDQTVFHFDNFRIYTALSHNFIINNRLWFSPGIGIGYENSSAYFSFLDENNKTYNNSIANYNTFLIPLFSSVKFFPFKTSVPLYLYLNPTFCFNTNDINKNIAFVSYGAGFKISKLKKHDTFK